MHLITNRITRPMTTKAPCYLKKPVPPENVIPQNIFQTWSSHVIPDGMFKASQSWKDLNPDWQYQLFHHADRRLFIKTHFHTQVLSAYDELIPRAYQADLWRYCVLYAKGGCYVDIKLQAKLALKQVLSETDQFIVPYDSFSDEKGFSGYLAQAFLAATPGHPVLRHAIAMIVDNTLSGYYGQNSLWPTGPGLLGMALNAALGRPLLNTHSPGQFDFNKGTYTLLPPPNFKTNVLKLPDGSDFFLIRYDKYKKDKYSHIKSLQDFYTVYPFAWTFKKVYKSGLAQKTHPDLKELKRSHAAVIRILYKNKSIKEARRHWLKTLLSRHRSWRLTEAILFELQYLFKLG